MALGPLHLADRSAWEQARYNDTARARMHELRESGRLAVCLVSMTELLYSARNAGELAQLRVDLASLPYLHLTASAERQVGDTMAALAGRGQHRTPLADLVLAATAQAGSAVVLHYDIDYERIAAVTGQAHEWILRRGTGHGGHDAV